ncbi:MULTISPECIES: DUF6303 family protein [Streptomyces rochei group]|uniref:DUF6303 family protein n=1 Tax=Streptomyces rochei group TaxID=2867164 RepID=UPI0018775049|nr:DUF6303 family protein [Streptomyces vinaceusdrappus]GHC26969.1 hypothetical protein GCM10010308_49830 [Streptomyces vinaceusdrappus]
MNDAVTWAACAWSGEDGMWQLRIIRPEIEVSPMTIVWEDAVRPPTLADRYDGLADLGYAVVTGGPDAWKWTETLDDVGRTYLSGITEVRPLTVAEAAERTGLEARQ